VKEIAGMEHMKLDAVIFDMDGLMLDSQRLGSEAWKETIASFGFLLTDENNRRLLGRDRNDSVEILHSIFGPQFPAREVWEKSYKNFFQKVESAGIPVKKGLWEILDFLEAENISKAVATMSTREVAVCHLEKIDLLRRFPVVVCGDEIEKGKPAPDIFLKDAELLHVSPGNCVVLEDSYSGVRAAARAGMVPVMEPDMIEADDEMKRLAHAVVKDLFEAKEEIEKLMAG
jgi:HAD superfamily hydrolase (TIGR01509 family)